MTGRTDKMREAADQNDSLACWQAPLIDLLCIFAHRKWLIGGAILLGAIAGGLQFMRTPPYYRASTVAVLLPREKPTVDFAVMTNSVETTEDGARRADSGSLMLPPQTDLYIALLDSRSVLESLAERFGPALIDHEDLSARDRSDEIIARLRRLIVITGTREGLLTITVTAADPEIASGLANALVEEGLVASKGIERQLLTQQAGFLANAVAIARSKLVSSEEELRLYCEEHRIIDPASQAEGRLRQIRELAAARDRAAVELEQRRVGYTEVDPLVREYRAGLQAIDERLVELRGDIVGEVDEAGYGAVLITYNTLRQRVRFRRDLLSTLSTQADVFRVRAEQPAGNIAIVRPAVTPVQPAGPSKKRILGVAVFVAIFMGVGLALLLEQISIARRTPALESRIARLSALTKHWHGPLRRGTAS